MICIIAGSEKDLAYVSKIENALKKLGVVFSIRIASAHKTPGKVLEIINETTPTCFITVAGLNDALSGMVAANTIIPVIASPNASPDSDSECIISALKLPEGVAPMMVLKPESAALAAAKIEAGSNEEIKHRVLEHISILKEKLEYADKQQRNL